ncbi:phosphoketolase [Methylorubrum zatmanii]|nr:phosphoketolase [Methylorubrum zatmanii]MCP1552132.1 phosphoketolase [Methylorubrum extorquens]MCP1581557.1 phosphoketolase [Methylorubrum extorquens]
MTKQIFDQRKAKAEAAKAALDAAKARESEVVLNELDQFHLAIEAIDRVPGLVTRAARAKQAFRDRLTAHKLCIREHGEDMPEIQGWRWPCEMRDESGDPH